MTKPEIGDRIKVTFGKNSLEGAVNHTWDGGDLTLDLDALPGFVAPTGGSGRVRGRLLIEEWWTIEILPRPAPVIPDVVGTVAMDAAGGVWHRQPCGWVVNGQLIEATIGSISAAYGPMEQLLAKPR